MAHPECLHFPDCTLFRNSFIAISAFGPLLPGKVKAKNNYESCNFFRRGCVCFYTSCRASFVTLLTVLYFSTSKKPGRNNKSCPVSIKMEITND